MQCVDLPLDRVSVKQSLFILMDREQFDLAIVGGGIVGLSLATALAEAGLATALVERANLKELMTRHYDARGSAIAAGSQRILNGIGVWGLVDSDAEPILEIRIADGAAPVFLHYSFHDIDDGPLGWIVENETLRGALTNTVLDSGTTVFQSEVNGAQFDSHCARLKLSCGRSINTRLVVAADGRNSPLRATAGIKSVSWNYPQTSIVCTISHDAPHCGIAHEHFQSGGPFAILPMTRNRAAIVWTEQSSTAKTIQDLNDGAFETLLRQKIGDFLGEIKVCSRRSAYPLSVVHAVRYTAPRFALIGDAAHAIHPIAGQGLNLGLRDVASLAEVIIDAARLGLDPGSSEILERYQSWRRPENMLMIAVTDTLNRLFSNKKPQLRLLRDAGLLAVNRIDPMKKLFMRHAMGISGSLPRLARGEPL